MDCTYAYDSDQLVDRLEAKWWNLDSTIIGMIELSLSLNTTKDSFNISPIRDAVHTILDLSLQKEWRALSNSHIPLYASTIIRKYIETNLFFKFSNFSLRNFESWAKSWLEWYLLWNLYQSTYSMLSSGWFTIFFIRTSETFSLFQPQMFLRCP